MPNEFFQPTNFIIRASGQRYYFRGKRGFYFRQYFTRFCAAVSQISAIECFRGAIQMFFIAQISLPRSVVNIFTTLAEGSELAWNMNAVEEELV